MTSPSSWPGRTAVRAGVRLSFGHDVMSWAFATVVVDLQRLIRSATAVGARRLADALTARLACNARRAMPTDRTKPLVFLGCSEADNRIAEAFRKVMKEGSLVSVELWSDAFREGETILAGLLRVLDKFDFGVFLLSGDQLSGKENPSEIQRPLRANVLLEFGMFAGRHGIERTFPAIPEKDAADLPSDLGGLIFGSYDAEDENIVSGVRTAAARARDRAIELGPRPPGSGSQATSIPDSLVGAAPDAWRIAARKHKLTAASPSSIGVGDEIVDAAHGWGIVAELEPGAGGVPTATVIFPRGFEAKLRVSRLFVADL